MTADWELRVNALADELVERGKLRSEAWQQAFRAVPRHIFVPGYHRRVDGEWQWTPTDSGVGLEAVYSNTALFTAVDDNGIGMSSSSQPGLMTRMLELLDVRDGHRVLEIGTGGSRRSDITPLSSKRTASTAYPTTPRSTASSPRWPFPEFPIPGWSRFERAD